MEKIRQLLPEDTHHYAKMKTDLPTDYMLTNFDRISAYPNTIYGIFLDDKLVCIGGYTLFGTTQAMLGRLRTDKNFRRKGLAVKLMQFVLNEIHSDPDINWIGGYTEVSNTASKNLQNQLNLAPIQYFYHATLSSVPITFLTQESQWSEIKTRTEKIRWLNKVYIDSSKVIPYECYYPLPSSSDLFTEQQIKDWSIFKNPKEDRLLILKPDYKGSNYLHIVYPYDDIMKQQGLWETVDDYYHQYVKRTSIKPTLWLDIETQNMNDSLLKEYFTISPEWVLSGKYFK